MKRIDLPAECLPIFDAVRDLRRRYVEFPELSFTPDGHMVGHIGVAIAAELFDLKPTRESTAACDAIGADGSRVEVKASGAKDPKFAFRRIPEETPPPDRVLIFYIDWEKLDAFLVYDGSYSPIGERLAAGKWGSNGQQSITLSTVKQLND